MRIFCIAILLGACGDGSRGGSIAAPTDFPTDDQADLLDGTDNGKAGAADSTPFAACMRESDCTRGSCLGASLTRSGFCLTICAAPSRGQLPAGRVEPCGRGETCVIVEEGGTGGVCLLPCTTNADCADTLRCEPLSPGQPQRFCVVKGGSVDEQTDVTPAPSSSG